MSRLYHLASLLFLLFWGAAGLAAAEPLGEVRALRALPLTEASAGRQVRLSGVVSYLRLTERDFNFNLHDDSGGVMVYPENRTAIQPGQFVTVTGVTAMSVHGLRVTRATVVPGEMRQLPLPRPVAMAEVLAASHEGEFVEVEGVVRVARLESPDIAPRRLALDFGSRARRLTAWVTHYDTENPPAPGTRLRVRGVVVIWKNPRGQAQSVNLMVNSMADVAAVAPAIGAEDSTISSTLLWQGPDATSSLTRVSGVVTLHQPGELLVLQDGPHAIRVRPAPENPPVKIGDQLSAEGFPALGDYTVELEDARYASTASTALPSPEPFGSAAAVLAGPGLVDRDGRRISVPGTLRAVRERGDGLALEVESGRATFLAWLPPGSEPPPEVAPGAGLLLSGICTLQLSPTQRRLGRAPDQFSLHIASVADLQVTRTVPWWTTRRLYTALALAGAVALLLAAWAGMLRSRNRMLSAEIDARLHAEQELAHERHRVAAELHDTLEQTLVAAGLQLNAATRTLPARPDAAAAQVALAHQLVARSRQEVRDAVWDLRLDSAQPGSLSTLLAQVCAESSTQASAPVSFTSEGPERPLPALVIAQAIRLVREAIANALKHAAPRSVRVSMRQENGALHLAVTDDGCGFEPATAPGPDAGHFGLSGMKERAQRIGGMMAANSQPGQGTTIAFQIPTP